MVILHEVIRACLFYIHKCQQQCTTAHPRPHHTNEEDIEFDAFINQQKAEMEQNIQESQNIHLNQDFTWEENQAIVNHSKSGKAPGIDGFLNECFTNVQSKGILVSLFNACLRSNPVPKVWSFGVINPIPKSRDNNPRIPLNYRGISLLPVSSKLYTAAKSARITKYLEKTNKLCNEQNGFRQNRSCLDHVYTLHNLCKMLLA